MSPQTSSPLDSPEVSVKLFVADPSGVRMKELIPVFHRWIKEDLLEGELQIDVATYEHVPKGPGVVIICDKAHYYFEDLGGRLGLRFRARREARGAGAEAVTVALRQVLLAAKLLEDDPALEGRYCFRTDELELGIVDRLAAPSAKATLDAIREDVGEAVGSLFESKGVQIELLSGPREPFLVSVKTGASPSVSELLDRLAAARS